MKIAQFVFLAYLGVAGTANASSYRTHVLDQLNRVKDSEIKQFGEDLAFALNEFRHCPREFNVNYGTQIVSLTFSDTRVIRTFTIVSKGRHPMPSGAEFESTATVTSTTAVEKGIPAPGRPNPRDYKCEISEK